jgi:ribonuclease HI
MGEKDGYRLFSLRVQNMTRSCVLLKKFDNGIWTMPVITIKMTEDPKDFLDEILQHVATDDKFEVVSMVSMLEWCQENREKVEQHSIICDLRYTGKVLSKLTGRPKDTYTESKWVQKGMLDNYRSKANYPLYAYIKASEKESCLR